MPSVAEGRITSRNERSDRLCVVPHYSWAVNIGSKSSRSMQLYVRV